MAEPVDVLLVEDNPDHAELVRRGLQESGNRVRLHVVPDGEAAMDFLHRRGAWADPARSPRPRLVILDLRLPRVDGIEVLRAIKQDPTLLDLPTVILTTSDAEKDLVQAYANHANSYLIKPIDFSQFVEVLGELEVYWLDLNRQPRHGVAGKA